MLNDTKTAVSAAHIRNVFIRYGEAHSAGDVDRILEIFAEDAVVRDPANGPEHRGKPALRAFFETGIEASGGPIEMKLEGEVRIAGNEGAAAYIVRTVSSAPVFRVATLDVMTFGQDGLVEKMVAYWGPDNFQQEET